MTEMYRRRLEPVYTPSQSSAILTEKQSAIGKAIPGVNALCSLCVIFLTNSWDDPPSVPEVFDPEAPTEVVAHT
jgi:hypothetical protein